MSLQNNDLFIVQRGGVQYKMTATQIADFVGAVRDYTVADITARDAQTGMSVGDRIFVTDASADSTVDSGWAIYRVQSTGPNTFFKVQEQEGMDLVITGESNLSYSASPTQGSITNDNGSGAVIPVVDGTNAGLATPQMLANSHLPASAGLTPGTNPINVNASQELTFDINQLQSLP